MSAKQQRDWEDIGKQLKVSELQRVRTAATTWSTTIGTISGVSSIVSFLSIRTDVSKLDGGYQLAIAGLLTLSAIAVILAILVANRASVGGLEKIPNTATDIRTYYATAPGRAVQQIRCSQAITLFSFICLFGALGVTWYGSTSKVADYLYPLGMGKGVVCGHLQTNTQGQVSLISEQGAVSYPITDTAKLTQIDNCG